MSVRTPTRSELNTFKVMSNLDFTDLTKQEPQKWSPAPARVPEEPPEMPYAHEEVQKEGPSDTWGGADMAGLHGLSGLESLAHESGLSSADLKELDKHAELETLVEQDTKRDEAQMEKGQVPDDSRRDQEEVRESSATRRRAAQEAAMEASIEKEALLYELELMEKQGLIKLHRNLDMNNTLEEIQYQYDRTNMIVSTQQTVDWAKTGIKMGSSILEALMKKFGISVVEGFSNNLCKDMNKFNKPLTKMYRKYWRRGTSSPEMELAMIVFGALAMTVMGNKGLMGSKPSEPLARPVVPDAVSSATGSANGVSSSASALRPPSMNAFGNFSAPVQQQQKPTVVPEWARAALAGPLGSEAPQHFAKAEVRQVDQTEVRQTGQTGQADVRQEARQTEVPDTFPELNRDLQMPVRPMPVSASVEHEVPDVRRLTLASPKSSRRRKEPVTELNLDL